MLRSLRLAALGLSVVALSSRLAAQPTPGPPDWHDGGKSVYLPHELPHQPPAAPEPIPSSGERHVAALQSSSEQTADPVPRAATPKTFDPKVVPSAHEEAAPSADSSARCLAPPSTRQGNDKSSTRNGSTGVRRFADLGIPTQSIYTIATALAIVIGAFLIFAWALRRSGRGAAGRGGILPTEVVSVLGRIRLSSRQAAELLRVGNKLVLVALTPTGAETITEVTEQVEVDRLVGLCQQDDRYSTTKAFEQVFQQMSREPVAAGGFLGAEALPASISPVAAAYRSQRGGTARG